MCRHKVLCVSLIISVIVFILFATAIDDIWFKTDDLGCIIAGQIQKPSDVVRIFSEDHRTYTTAANFTIPRPNVISGFLRPIQHVFFSILSVFAGLNPHAFYYMNVLFHALNAGLLCLLCSYWMPLAYASVAALLYALYPDMTWLTWISTLQNLLALFFLLLTFISYLRKRFYLSGILFLLSLLSRESALFMPFVLVLWVYIFCTNRHLSWLIRVKQTIQHTWIFFAVQVVYVFMRLHAFGVQSLGRTLNNMLLRFQWLAPLFAKFHQQVVATNTISAQKVTSIAFFQKSFASTAVNVVEKMINSFWRWTEVLFFLPTRTFEQCVVACVIIALLAVFVWISYKRHRQLMWLLILSCAVASWPCILAYPNTRYMHLVYPIIAFLLSFGVYQIAQALHRRPLVHMMFFGLCGSITLVLIVRAITWNRASLYAVAQESVAHAMRYDDFFSQYSFTKAKRCIVLSNPYESDLQGIFRAYSGNFQLEVVQEIFSTLAQKGILTCARDYRIKHVPSYITAIPGGFRLTSLDKEHCAWWMHFSYYPLRWQEQERSYVWSSTRYNIEQWYPCSIGSFMIHEIREDLYITDISFVYDRRWIDADTVFVSWDTMQGTYKLLDVRHLNK